MWDMHTLPLEVLQSLPPAIMQFLGKPSNVSGEERDGCKEGVGSLCGFPICKETEMSRAISAGKV